MAVIEPREDGLHLLERGPGISIEEIAASTEARLIHGTDIPEMVLQ